MAQVPFPTLWSESPGGLGQHFGRHPGTREAHRTTYDGSQFPIHLGTGLGRRRNPGGWDIPTWSSTVSWNNLRMPVFLGDSETWETAESCSNIFCSRKKLCNLWEFFVQKKQLGICVLLHFALSTTCILIGLRSTGWCSSTSSFWLDTPRFRWAKRRQVFPGCFQRYGWGWNSLPWHIERLQTEKRVTKVECCSAWIIDFGGFRFGSSTSLGWNLCFVVKNLKDIKGYLEHWTVFLPLVRPLNNWT